jgi:glycosyltransferase involved in cell wall biosynthesis
VSALLAFGSVDVLFDYRPALRARTGTGEYMHELLASLAERPVEGEHLHLFTSSWKDRPEPALGALLPGVTIHDHRVPVRVLHWTWHRLGLPSIEALVGGEFDLAHSAHPLLMPARQAAQVITIHDLDFLEHPERTAAEVRRDYADRVGVHARRADGILTPSESTRRDVIERLAVDPAKVIAALPGPPRWTLSPVRRDTGAGNILFVGTLEPRKNVGTLLDAYTILRDRRRDAPFLEIAGRATAAADEWIARCQRAPLAGRVHVHGYVSDSVRRDLFANAAVLVLPSWNEGFGLPALEAMAAGVPVVAANRGALPEVVADAGILVDPASAEDMADGLERVLDDSALAASLAARGRERAATFSWEQAADRLRSLYRYAVDARASRHARRG